jgi:hypothetical protein
MLFSLEDLTIFVGSNKKQKEKEGKKTKGRFRVAQSLLRHEVRVIENQRKILQDP